MLWKLGYEDLCDHRVLSSCFTADKSPQVLRTEGNQVPFFFFYSKCALTVVLRFPNTRGLPLITQLGECCQNLHRSLGAIRKWALSAAVGTVYPSGDRAGGCSHRWDPGPGVQLLRTDPHCSIKKLISKKPETLPCDFSPGICWHCKDVAEMMQLMFVWPPLPSVFR